MVNQWRSRTFARRKFSVFVVAIVLALTLASGTMLAATSLTESPTKVTFAPTVVDGTSSYQVVRITNNGDTDDTLGGAYTSADPPFLPVFGGTCGYDNVNGVTHVITASGGYCDFVWAFTPVKAGKVSATGTFTFTSGSVLNVSLEGRGTKH